MELTERRAGKTVVLAPAGRIDMATADQFRERLIPLISSAAAGGESVVLDFSAVDYISSAGLRVLMLAAKEARSSGGRIAVAALQPLVNEIFQISRFDKVVACHAGVDDALAAVSAPA
ncbi:MAG: anti-sigma factor antagonist [Betaproteobacteria bacterium]|nr:anti-sigma factor antagonist [Betaproteobacteria bacterium]